MAQPIHTIKFGGVSVSVFERTSEKYGTSQSFALGKSYKDKNDEWVNQVVYLNNAVDINCVILALQELLVWKYKKDEVKSEPEI